VAILLDQNDAAVIVERNYRARPWMADDGEFDAVAVGKRHTLYPKVYDSEAKDGTSVGRHNSSMRRVARRRKVTRDGNCAKRGGGE
jgi:hypothetical protein